ncbi:MAG: histidine phosphatase family protein [Candidatus Eiseniibacteriota bacterium]
MTLLALVRHGPTEWNTMRRLQGRVDLPLSTAGQVYVSRWRLPAEVRGFTWVSSPLLRARETAAMLGLKDVAVVRALIETDWGEWEGKTLAELRALDAAGVAAAEAKGLDFRPPGGESAREVQNRLKPWLARVAASGVATGAITHKGVIRAVLALATGWAMTSKPPARLDWDAVHLFRLAPDGTPAIERLNIPFETT